MFLELQSSDEVFYQRTARGMLRLEKQLLEWNANGDYDAQLDAIRTTVSGLCAAIANEDSSKERCETFLAAA
jgi:hypothetical protein